MTSRLRSAAQDMSVLNLAFLMLKQKNRLTFHVRDRERIRRHLAADGPKKLHIGAGFNAIPGWLNTDLLPRSAEVVFLDATRRFPFPDASLDYVYSEHVIEHMPYDKGLRLLREAARVLRPGGRVRIATPDLQFLLELCGDDRTELERRYIQWSAQEFLDDGDGMGAEPCFVFNNFVRNWGHTFIYDGATLQGALALAGLEKAERCELNASADDQLANLENEDRMPDGFLRLETMVWEAVKP